MKAEGTSPAAQEPGRPVNGEDGRKHANAQRVISRPSDVAGLVLMQVDAVNAKKDDLTIAIKGLTDTAKQLVRAYSDHAQAIVKLQQRVKELEEKQRVAE